MLHNHNDNHNDHERSRYGSGANESLASLGAPDDVVGHEHHHDHGVAFHPHSTIRSLILLIALSFHSVFEGLAIGLQQDLGQLISLFIAVIAHKAIMAFSLGLTLAQASLSAKQYVMSIMIFSLASPFGMGIGNVPLFFLTEKIMKKFVKLYLHLSYIVQNTLHFDEIFSLKINFEKKSLKKFVKLCLHLS